MARWVATTEAMSNSRSALARAARPMRERSEGESRRRLRTEASIFTSCPLSRAAQKGW